MRDPKLAHILVNLGSVGNELCRFLFVESTEGTTIVNKFSSKSVSWQIKSWYIKILIAAHIDTGTTETDVIPSMLTFQYQADRGKGKNHYKLMK